MKDGQRQFRVASFAVFLACTLAGGVSFHFAVPAQTSPTVHLTLLSTTDLHGNIEPIDYYTNQPAQLGLAKVATLIQRVRAERPNVLLFDSGDTIQGTPLAYFAAREDADKTNPMVLAMNALRYDAAAAGNHEFNFGLDVLWKVKGEAHYPILAANIKQTYGSGPQHFEPYVIKQIAGVRVAIVGFVTPAVPRAELPANYRGYEFEPIVDTARRVIPEVRKRADIVVVLSHSGLPPAPAWSDEMRGENSALELAQQISGIDVILLGHSHNEVPERIVNGVLLTQAKYWGQSLARVDLDLSHAADGHWQITSKHSAVIAVNDQVPPDPKITELTAPYEKATQAYLDTPVANSVQELRGATERFEDGPLVDLINAVQMEAGHADVSISTLYNTATHISKGHVTVRQIFPLFVYDHYLYTVEMTGAELRAALEHAAGMYQRWPLPPGEKLQLPDFNVDSAAGVNYTIDLRQPAGRRIVNLTFRGHPLGHSQKLRVALSNYRYSGSGGYDYRSMPIVYRSSQEIRDLIIEHLKRAGTFPTAANHNWHIEPQEAVEALRRSATE